MEAYKQYKSFNRQIQEQLLVLKNGCRRKVAKECSSQGVHLHGLDKFAGMPENYEGNATLAQGTYLSSYFDALTKFRDEGVYNEKKRCIKGSLLMLHET